MTLGKDDYKASLMEVFFSNPLVVAAATAAAAAGSATFGAAIFLPVLTSTLAARRHEQRVGKFIENVSEDLERLDSKLDELSDAQYQLIGDSVACALQTINQEKLDYLRHAIRNALIIDIEPAKTAYISRCLRDISPEEASFLIRTIDETEIAVVQQGQVISGVFSVAAGSTEELLLTGLAAMGLLGADDTMGGRGYFYWKPGARLLCSLINE